MRLHVLFVLSLIPGLGAGPAWAQFAVPALSGRVVDEAGILADATERQLTALLAEHEDSTSNQVAVVTVPSLGGLSVEEAGLRVAEAWALGQAERDNGVLLLVAPNERELRIEVGDGLEGVLPDVLAGRIIRNEIVPYFRDGDFDAGVLVGTQTILSAIEGEYEDSAAASGEPFGRGESFLVGVLFLLTSSFFAFTAIMAAGCARWFVFVFMLPFFGAGGAALTESFWGGLIAMALYIILFILAIQHPQVKAASEAIAKAQRTGEHSDVRVGPLTFSTRAMSSSGPSGGGGGSSFSGGGGSFSGGGASGSW